MKEKRILNCLNDVNDQFIQEAAPHEMQNKKLYWIKWYAVAASLVCLLTLSAGFFMQKFHTPSYTVTLDNENKITFSSSDAHISNLDIAIVGMRALSQTESHAILGGFAVDAYIGFEENTNEFIYMEGTIDNMKIIVTRSDISPDLVLDGEEKVSDMNGIPVSAGYFLTKANSQGNQTAIVYASFTVGNYTIQLETSGPKEDCDILCKVLAEKIQTMIDTSSLDFEQIKY